MFADPQSWLEMVPRSRLTANFFIRWTDRSLLRGGSRMWICLTLIYGFATGEIRPVLRSQTGYKGLGLYFVGRLQVNQSSIESKSSFFSNRIKQNGTNLLFVRLCMDTLLSCCAV